MKLNAASRFLVATAFSCMTCSFQVMAQGFASSPLNWSTPLGGQYNSSGTNLGYVELYGYAMSNTNAQSWGIADMNGDGKQDLVVTSQYSGQHYQFGVGTSPYWKVYLGTGSGFASTASNWSTPVGGQYLSSGTNLGYGGLYGSAMSNTNSQSWGIADMNGDGMPDLVVTSQYNGGLLQFGAGTAPYWKVYLNTGSGFSGTPTAWSTPIGGQYNSSGTNLGYLELWGYAFSNTNSQNYGLADMNGDGMPDLVAASQYNGQHFQFGVGSAPYWKVYLNTGSGFSGTSTNWSTPAGGQYLSSGTNLGFDALTSTAFSYANAQSWGIADMNGDHKPDLVVTSQYNGGLLQFGAGTAPYWKVYLNSGSGFSGTPTTWSTPIGGQYNSSGTNLGFLEMSGYAFSNTNSQNYGMADMNGDGLTDLVVNSQYSGQHYQFGAGTAPYWKVYLNTGSGFSGSATNWSTPVGGQYLSSGANLGFGALYSSAMSNANSQSWGMADMNGDGRQDLVVTSQYNGSLLQFGVGASPYWKVYLNSGITGIDAVNGTAEISVFPNPGNGTFVVEAMDQEPSAYQITALTGEVVQEGKLIFGRNELQLKKAKGVYLITITSAEKTLTKRIVLQ